VAVLLSLFVAIKYRYPQLNVDYILILYIINICIEKMYSLIEIICLPIVSALLPHLFGKIIFYLAVIFLKARAGRRKSPLLS